MPRSIFNLQLICKNLQQQRFFKSMITPVIFSLSRSLFASQYVLYWYVDMLIRIFNYKDFCLKDTTPVILSSLVSLSNFPHYRQFPSSFRHSKWLSRFSVSVSRIKTGETSLPFYDNMTSVANRTGKP